MDAPVQAAATGLGAPVERREGREKVTGTARYVRMSGTERGTAWGYSLWEFKVYAGCGTD